MTKSAPQYTVAAHKTGFAVLRDGAAIKTPGERDFVVPARALAEAVADEWRAQKEKINHASMPLTQLAMTALDITQPNRAAVVGEVAGFAASDLLCFFAEAPDELVARQKKTWQPVLNWAARRFDAPLNIGQGIMPVEQQPASLRALRRAIEKLDDFTLTGIKHAAEVTGSLALALALVEREMEARAVFEAAELEASFEVEKWGEDPAVARRHESILGDLAACAKWFELLKADKT